MFPDLKRLGSTDIETFWIMVPANGLLRCLLRPTSALASIAGEERRRRIRPQTIPAPHARRGRRGLAKTSEASKPRATHRRIIRLYKMRVRMTCFYWRNAIRSLPVDAQKSAHAAISSRLFSRASLRR